MEPGIKLDNRMLLPAVQHRCRIPELAQIVGTSPPPGSPLHQADHAYKTAIAGLASQASLGIQPRPVTKRRSRQAPVAARNLS